MSKKILQIFALLMIAAMTIPTLVGCITPDVENSDTGSNISDEESELPEDKGEPVVDPEFSTLISGGIAYTTSVEAGEKYPDSYGIELTDGITAPKGSADYTEGNYSGYLGSTPLEVILDLSEVHTRIYEVRLGYLSTTNAGIAPPSGVEVQVSEDGTNFTSAGTMDIPEFVEGDRLEAVFTSQYYLTAKYVKLIIKKMNSWIFIDEISVISDEEIKLSADEKFLEAIKSAYDKLGTVKYEGKNTPDKEMALQLVSQG